MSIRRKLFLLFLALAVVPMAVVAAVSFFNSVASVESVVRQRAMAATEEVASSLADFLEFRRSEVELLSWNSEIEDLYAHHGSPSDDLQSTPPRLEQFFHQFFTGPREGFVRLYYLNSSGQLLLTYRAQAEGAEPGLERFAVTAGDASLPGPDLLRRVDEDGLQITNHRELQVGSVLRYLAPVEDPRSGARHGFLVADLQVDHILRETGLDRQSAARSEDIVIIARDQERILFHSRSPFSGRGLDQALPDLAVVYPEMASQSSGSVAYASHGEKRLASYTNLDEANWTVAALINPAQFTGPVRYAGWANLGITFAAILLTLILVPLVIGRVTASIRRLTEGAEAIAAGNLDQQITVDTHDETRTLADAFNRMAVGLKSTLGELRQLTAELEDRVRRRTADLEEANRTVQEQNEQLLRERAAERVRAAAMAMESPEDLRNVAGVLFTQVRGLGVDTVACGIQFLDPRTGELMTYQTMLNPRRHGLRWTSPEVSEYSDEVITHGPIIRDRDDSRVDKLMAMDVPETRPMKITVESMHDFLGDELGIDTDAVETNPYFSDGFLGDWQITNVPFDYGVLTFREREHDPEHTTVVQELATALNLGFVRFLDFQRVEAQNEALEDANRQIQEANRLKSEFLANMSHELRTPMNAIVGFTKIVHRRARGSLDDKQVDNLEKVLESSEILMNLINDILDLSKIEAGRLEIERERLSMRDLVGGCVSTIGPLVKDGVAVTTDIDPGVDVIYSDATRIRQILINLLSNAAKFTDSGTISVSLRPSGDEQIELAVADSGIGIPAAALEQIFDEFRQVDGTTTRKYGGTGLGLSISQKLAGMLGGDIRVDSEEGKGSTFTVTLAAQLAEVSETNDGATDAPAAPAGGVPAPGKPDGSRRIVLAIDDDPNVLSVITQELEEEGYQVIGATRAIEGIEKAKQLGPHAITLDIMMPGMDGWEAITRLKDDVNTRDIPLIVVSIIDNKDLGFRLGADDYLVKPIDKDALLAVLQKFHGRGRQALVVDDDPVVIDLARQLLEEDGWTVRGAANGQQGLDEIARSRPDVVLLDLMMPVMDGFETLRRLRQDPETANLPVIVVTAKDLSSQELDDLRRNTARVIEKDGMDRDRILAELRESLKMVDTAAS